MLQNHFPDLNRPGFNPEAAFVGPNLIIHTTGSEVEFPEHRGALSIKCAWNGQEIYEADKTRFAVNDSAYLMLNEHQRYSSYIYASRPVESFCIFFQPHFAERALAALVTPDDRLLDDPFRISSQPLLFLEKLYPHDTVVSPLLFRLRSADPSQLGSAGWLEEQFHELLEALLWRHRQIYREIEKLPAVRLSTRLELYRRLHLARDFIESSLDLPVTLNQMAEVANLSPHHFLRLFKQIFHQTPHQYLTQRRLEKARQLLLQTDWPITQVCLEVGFESLTTFSGLFRRKVGFSPAEFRRRSST